MANNTHKEQDDWIIDQGTKVLSSLYQALEAAGGSSSVVNNCLDKPFREFLNTCIRNSICFVYKPESSSANAGCNLWVLYNTDTHSYNKGSTSVTQQFKDAKKYTDREVTMFGRTAPRWVWVKVQ
jgi:hypothetical protein